MPFSAAELQNIANATLDHYIKGPALSQVLQNRPTYNALRRAQKSTPGGKGDISIPVKGVYTTTITPYTHDDVVTYQNPANIRRANYTWREHHAGISLTLTELKHDGISVVDSLDSAQTRDHNRVELVRLTGLLQDKLEDLMEGWARDFTAKLYRDPTTLPNNFLSVRGLIEDDPTVNTVGGIDRTTTPWWRNRALAGGTAIATTVGGEEVIFDMHREMRQLRRYGGRPNFAVCGSDFLDRLGVELRARGNYTDTGFTRRTNTDIGMAEIAYNGLVFQYEPVLDDVGREKYCYVMDTRHMYLYVMDGEDMKRHSPARPADQYVMYRAITWTGQLCMDQPNSCGVYAIV